jgi:hypothetical protein
MGRYRSGAIRALIESMHRRCQAVIRSRGGNTRN